MEVEIIEVFLVERRVEGRIAQCSDAVILLHECAAGDTSGAVVESFERWLVTDMSNGRKLPGCSLVFVP
jgi:hypothetical protein